MWELDCEESWAPKNWCFWTVVLEKTLESPLDSKEILPVHPRGDQSWVFIGRTAVEAETPILWPPDVKSWLIGKDPDAGRNWGQEEKGTREDEMAGWCHRLDGRWVWVNWSWWWTGRPGVLRFMGVAKSRTRLSDWTELSNTNLLLTSIITTDKQSNKCSLTFSLACWCPSPIFLKLAKYSFSKFFIFWVCDSSHSVLSSSAKRVNCWFLLCFISSLICKAISLSCSRT